MRTSQGIKMVPVFRFTRLASWILLMMFTNRPVSLSCFGKCLLAESNLCFSAKVFGASSIWLSRLLWSRVDMSHHNDALVQRACWLLSSVVKAVLCDHPWIGALKWGVPCDVFQKLLFIREGRCDLNKFWIIMSYPSVGTVSRLVVIAQGFERIQQKFN